MTIDGLMRKAPVIPVLVIHDVSTAQPLAEALVAGGLPVLEVTLRTPQALDAVAAMRQVSGACGGVGTVTDPEQLRQVYDLGVEFAVTPGLTPALIETAHALPELPLLPGVMTASELMQAHAAGFDRLKLFPAAAAGGVALLKSLAGPFPEVKFCPTGGINAANRHEYLALDNVLCVGGSWVAPADRVAVRDWAAVTALASEASRVSA